MVRDREVDYAAPARNRMLVVPEVYLKAEAR